LKVLSRQLSDSGRKRNVQFMDLLAVAHVEATDDFYFAVLESGQTETRRGALNQPGKYLADAFNLRRHRQTFGSAVIVNDIRTHQTGCAVHRGRKRHHNLFDPKLSGIPSGMHRSGAAVSKKRKLSWIIATLHGGSANQIAHVC